MCFLNGDRARIVSEVSRRRFLTKSPDDQAFKGTVSKNEESNKRVVFKIDDKDIEESFSRGSGPGGQSVNKTQNKVRLVHKPTNISVYCHEARDLSTNRRIARRLLQEKVELHLFGKESKVAKRIDKLRERKLRAYRRAHKKYHPADGKIIVSEESSVSDDSSTTK